MSHALQHRRRLMVEQLIRTWDVLDSRILDAFMAVRRENFAPAGLDPALVFGEINLDIGEGELMLAPQFEGKALQLTLPQAGERVLEIGTGSGHFAALLAHMQAVVTTIELHSALHLQACERLLAEGCPDVVLLAGDAFVESFSGHFDVVIFSGAVPALPPHMLSLLAPQGRLYVVEGQGHYMQAKLYRHRPQGHEVQVVAEYGLPLLHHVHAPVVFEF